jgi:hypothetical protein
MAIIATGFAIATAPACKKDEDKTTTTTDARDASVGSYTGQVLYTVLFSQVDSAESDTIIFLSEPITVSKGDDKKIKITDTDLTVTTSNVTGDNSYNFSIPSQGGTIDGDNITLEGFKIASDANVHGTYDSGTKKLVYNIKGSIDFNGTPVPFTYEAVYTKQ